MITATRDPVQLYFNQHGASKFVHDIYRPGMVYVGMYPRRDGGDDVSRHYSDKPTPDRQIRWDEWTSLGLLPHDPAKKLTYGVWLDIDEKSNTPETTAAIIEAATADPYITFTASKSVHQLGHLFVMFDEPVPCPDRSAYAVLTKIVFDSLDPLFNAAADPPDRYLVVHSVDHIENAGAFEVRSRATKSYPAAQLPALPPSPPKTKTTQSPIGPEATAFIEAVEEHTSHNCGWSGNKFNCHTSVVRAVAKKLGYEPMPTDATGRGGPEWNCFLSIDGDDITVVSNRVESQWDEKTWPLKKKTKKTKTKVSASRKIVKLAEAADQHLRNQNKSPYACYESDGITRMLPLDGEEYASRLQRLYKESVGQYPMPNDIKGAVETLVLAAADPDRPSRKTYVRVACEPDRIVIDRCDPTWATVEITGDAVTSGKNQTEFVRYDGMQALPEPKPGGKFDDLWHGFNYSDDTQMRLTGFLIGCFYPGPKPILLNLGDEGSGKTTLQKRIRSIFDPSGADITSFPTKEDALHIRAERSAMLCYDNLDALNDASASMVCRASSGGGYTARTHFRNRDEQVFYTQVPIMLNGIKTLVLRADLNDRVIPLTTDRVQRFEDPAVLDAEFRKVLPGALWELYQVLSVGLRNLPTVEVPDDLRRHRETGFIKWVLACAPALAERSEVWNTSRFFELFEEGKSIGARELVDGSAWLTTLVDLVEVAPVEGTAGEVMAQVAKSNPNYRDGDWPRSARMVTSILKRSRVTLEKLGIDYSTKQGRARTTIHTVTPRNIE